MSGGYVKEGLLPCARLSPVRSGVRQRPSVRQSGARARELPLPLHLSSQEPLKREREREREKRHGVIGVSVDLRVDFQREVGNCTILYNCQLI